MIKRLAPNPEQYYYLRRINSGRMAADAIPPHVLAFLVQQGLIRLLPHWSGGELAELSAAGCLEAANG